ncbi:MAG: ABC transporter ATP-binding protein [Candidatus Omnitrophota bacterium]
MIKFEDITLSYNGQPVFKDFSMEINKGEKAVILGRSGLGKSSLFSLILGFVRPREGRVLFDGTCVDEKTVWDVRRRTAFVDQDVSLGRGKVFEWFSLISKFRANAALDFSRDRIIGTMRLFDLEQDLLNKDISELSGGERQRFAIVAAVLTNRKVFLLDEATSALDKDLKAKVSDFFLLRKDWTVVAISHDPVWTGRPFVKIFDLEEGKWKR